MIYNIFGKSNLVGDVSICCHQLAAVTDPDKAMWGTYCCNIVFINYHSLLIVNIDQLLTVKINLFYFFEAIFTFNTSPGHHHKMTFKLQISKPLQKKELLYNLLKKIAFTAKGQKVYLGFL